jgi:hypothetical protein
MVQTHCRALATRPQCGGGPTWPVACTPKNCSQQFKNVEAHILEKRRGSNGGHLTVYWYVTSRSLTDGY